MKSRSLTCCVQANALMSQWGTRAWSGRVAHLDLLLQALQQHGLHAHRQRHALAQLAPAAPAAHQAWRRRARQQCQQLRARGRRAPLARQRLRAGNENKHCQP